MISYEQKARKDPASATADKDAPGFGRVVLDRRVEISFMPMHVDDEPAEIQHLALAHHETAETRIFGLCIDAGPLVVGPPPMLAQA